MLIYTAARIGAVARLQIGSFTSDGSQWVLNFFEKGGKARIIPVRDDLGCSSQRTWMPRAYGRLAGSNRCSAAWTAGPGPSRHER